MPNINDALQAWTNSRMKIVNFIHKGMNTLTEMYSAFEAEVGMALYVYSTICTIYKVLYITIDSTVYTIYLYCIYATVFCSILLYTYHSSILLT